jgi:hypothetical protein
MTTDIILIVFYGEYTTDLMYNVGLATALCSTVSGTHILVDTLTSSSDVVFVFSQQ